MEGLRKRLLGSCAGVLPGIHRPASERPRGPGRAAGHHPPRRDDPCGPGGAPPPRASFLLIQPAALEDLRLDEDQRAKVAELSARAGRRWMATFGDPGHLPPPDRRVQLALEQARERGRGRRDPPAVARACASGNSPSRWRVRRLPGAGGRRGPRAHARAARTNPRHPGGDPLRPVARDPVGEGPRECRQVRGRDGDGSHPRGPHGGAIATMARAGRRAGPGHPDAFPCAVRDPSRPEAVASLMKKRSGRATSAVGSHLFK